MTVAFIVKSTAPPHPAALIRRSQASTHLAEETLLAHSSVPIGMIAAVATSGLAGFWVLVALLYYVPHSALVFSSSSSSSSSATSASASTSASSSDIAATTSLADTYSSLSYGVLASIFADATGTVRGTSALAGLVAVGLFMTGSASMTVATRLAFAMARDGALPFSRYLKRLPRWADSPAYAVGAVLLIVIAILLTPLGNPAALNAIVNPYFAYMQLAFAAPLILRVTYARKTFRRGPFHLGRFSEPVAWVAVVWLLGTTWIYFWPLFWPVTVETMNWNVVAFGGFGAWVGPFSACLSECGSCIPSCASFSRLAAAVLAAVWWFAWARLNFKGPRLRRGDVAPVGRIAATRGSAYRPARITPIDARIAPPKAKISKGAALGAEGASVEILEEQPLSNVSTTLIPSDLSSA